MSTPPPEQPGQQPYGQEPGRQPAQQPYGEQPYGQPAPGQPSSGGPSYGQQPPTEKRGLAIAALVLGILALLGCWIPVLNIGSIIMGLVGLILGIVAIAKASKGEAGGKVMAMVGAALSVLAIVLSIVVNVIAFNAGSTFIDENPEILHDHQRDSRDISPAALRPDAAHARYRHVLHPPTKDDA